MWNYCRNHRRQARRARNRLQLGSQLAARTWERQLQLVKSAEGCVSVDLPRKRLSINEKPCTPLHGKNFIDRLPNELLLKVTDFYLETEGGESESRYGEVLLPVILVSHRWRQLLEPLLYRKISFGSSHFPPDHKPGGWDNCSDECQFHHSTRLIKTLLNREDLQLSVKDVSVVVPATRDTDSFFHPIATILRKCKGIRHISYRDCWSSWRKTEIIAVLSTLRSLQSIQLSGIKSSDGLQWIFTTFDIPNVDEIRLSDYYVEFRSSGGIQARSTAPRDDIIREHVYYKQLDRPVQYNKQLSLTLQVRGISLIRGIIPFDAMRTLACWSSSLVHLRFNAPMGWAWISRCSPGVLQDIINAHQGTLQYIELPMIITAGGEIGYVPDVSRCTQLKKLHVYASNCFNEDAKWVAPKLSNPSLQHIVFDLTKFYDYVAFFHDLREREVQWMEHFAKRVKAGHSSSAGLQTLSMVYHSRIEDYSTMSTETVIWPWEYFEEAARIFNLYGIKMLYDAPSFTRAELEERLAVVRAYAARCELEGEEGEGEEEDEKTGEGEGEDEEEEEDEEDEEGEEGVNEKFNIPIPRQLEVGQHQLSKYWPVQPRQDPDA